MPYIGAVVLYLVLQSLAGVPQLSFAENARPENPLRKSFANNVNETLRLVNERCNIGVFITHTCCNLVLLRTIFSAIYVRIYLLIAKLCLTEEAIAIYRQRDRTL